MTTAITILETVGVFFAGLLARGALVIAVMALVAVPVATIAGAAHALAVAFHRLSHRPAHAPGRSNR